MSEDHQFDRRIEDVNVAALGTRLKALEDTVHQVITPELRDCARELVTNTLLVRTGNDAVERVERNTEDIVAAVEAAKGLWDFLTRWGSRLRRWSYSTAKWLGAIAGALAAFFAMVKGAADIDLIEHFLKWWHK